MEIHVMHLMFPCQISHLNSSNLMYMQLDNHQTAGSVRSSDDEKRKLAKASLSYNCEK